MNCEEPWAGLQATKTERTNGIASSSSVDLKSLLLQHVNTSQGLEKQILLAYKASWDNISYLTLFILFKSLDGLNVKGVLKSCLVRRRRALGLSLTALGPLSSPGDMLMCFIVKLMYNSCIKSH